MAKDFEIRNDISSDTESQVSDTRSDYRGELAKGDGVDLNEKSTEYLPNFLRDGQDEGKSINTLVESGDVRPTSVSFDVDHREPKQTESATEQAENDADTGQENNLESQQQENKDSADDLNSGASEANIDNGISTDVDSKDEFSKAMEYAPPPMDYTTAELPQESAIYCDAPANVGIGTDGIDLNDYRIREINDGMGAGPESNVEQYPEPEYAGHCDPPETYTSTDIDISE